MTYLFTCKNHLSVKVLIIINTRVYLDFLETMSEGKTLLINHLFMKKNYYQLIKEYVIRD